MEERDWGIYQVDVTADRHQLKGSPFLVLTNFGDHLLHHLFPTLDHGQLEYLYPVLLETTKQFGLEITEKSQWEMIVGQFKQIIKSTPNPLPPGHKKSKKL